MLVYPGMGHMKFEFDPTIISELIDEEVGFEINGTKKIHNMIDKKINLKKFLLIKITSIKNRRSLEN